MSKVLVSPSILACDFLHLEDEIIKIKNAGADMLHFDVMDGHFVNNISFGLPILKSISKNKLLVNDVHLMIDNPMNYYEDFYNAGADILTIHIEVIKDFSIFLKMKEYAKKNNKKIGVSIKPKTEFNEILPYLEYVDLVLVMSVEPGFGGQSFLNSSLKTIKKLSDIKKEKCLNFIIEVDGGINKDTSLQCIENGANSLVAGSYIFKADDYKRSIEDLRHGL